MQIKSKNILHVHVDNKTDLDIFNKSISPNTYEYWQK